MRSTKQYKNTRADKKELYTWMNKDKYEELASIAADKGIPVASLVRAAVLDYIKRLKGNERIVL